jgi:HPt (histidine-containing phosphotransfer) domain-containing protein
VLFRSRWLGEREGAPAAAAPATTAPATTAPERTPAPAAHPTPGDQAPAIHMAPLDKLRQLNARVVARVINAWLKDMPARVGELRDANAAADADALGRAAHSFKSASANVGAEPLAALCKELELACKQGAYDENLVTAVLAEADRAAQELLAILARETLTPDAPSAGIKEP